jgi:hypothetical protein
MNILKTIFFFFILSTQTIWAQSYIDQKDPFFISNKIIPSPKESSLCGPVTFINWLIHDNKINASDARELIKNLDRLKKGGINHGHTGHDLMAFIGRAEEQILDSNSYQLKLLSQFSLEDVVNNETQILLLRFNQLPKKRYNRFDEAPLHDDLSEDYSRRDFFHFVLKVPSSSGVFQLIDPEQPQKIIILSAKDAGGKILLSDEHYKYFGYTDFREAHEVQIIEVITKKN